MSIGATERKLNSIFGTPYTADGHADIRWQADNIIALKVPFPLRLAWDPAKTVTKIRVHKLVSDEFLAALTAIWNYARFQCKLKHGFNHTTAFYDGKALAWLKERNLDLYGGAFEFRAMRGKSTLSHHSWGIAIDNDPGHNPLGSRTTTLPKWYRDCWINAGFIWGGNWRKRPDPQHFEITHNVR